MIVMLGAIWLFFDLSVGERELPRRAGDPVICSISLVGFGMIAAVMLPRLPEKGQQVTYIFSAVLLLISGIYYASTCCRADATAGQAFADLLHAERHPRDAAGRRVLHQPMGQHLAAADHGRRLPAVSSTSSARASTMLGVTGR
ncbi:MAG: hypothetical protein R2855_03070 [Thermomicrobiales bacterium]